MNGRIARSRAPASFRFSLFRTTALLAVLAVFVPSFAPPAASGQDTAVESDAAARLIALLEKREGDAFWAAVTRLETLGEEAVPALLRGLEAPGEKTRLGCAKALLEIAGEKGIRKAIDALAELARNAKDRSVRIDAVQIYGMKEDPDLALPLLEELFDGATDPWVVIPLARTLWEVDHVARARDRLVDLLASRDLEVRAEAALTLAELGYYEAPVREILRSLRKEPTPRGRRAAALDRLVRLNRRLEAELSRGSLLLEGTDPAKLLELKEKRIRELEDALERAGRAGAQARPLTPGEELLQEVVEVIEETYVDPVKAQHDRLLLNAVKGMVRSLDEHSLFMEPVESRTFRQSLKGAYAGIGAQVTKRAQSPLEIVRPFYGGPAYKAGIQSGDRILEVDGLPTNDLQIEELVDLLKGPPGSQVELKVWRRGWDEPRAITVTRAVIEVPSVYSEVLPGRLGFIRVVQFGDRTAAEFTEALRKLEGQGIEGLILDLRSNPGGLLDAAVRITDLFVEGELPIVTLKGRSPQGEAVESIYPRDGIKTNYPLVVLVDPYSASASEVVAGALQDYGRARVVGRRTFGKGSVQKLFPLRSKEGARLKLTVQYYFLPLGRCIHTIRDEDGKVRERGGIEPDVTVTPEELPAWRLAARSALTSDPRVLGYVDRHLERLKRLIPYGDHGDGAGYPQFESFYRSLDTHAEPEDVRAVVRYLVQRRVEDERGREIPFDFASDRELQRGVLELLGLLGKKAGEFPEYAWFAGEISGEKKDASK